MDHSIFALPSTPLPSDGVETATLADQRHTEHILKRDLLPRASLGEDGTTLKKLQHGQWLAGSFFKLPKGYTSLDASKPWLLYWTIHSADLLGSQFDPVMRERIVSNVLHCLCPSGGFAGGAANTQIAHLLPSYAAVCALAIVGSEDDGWSQLAHARQEMYDFFMRCKRPDGGFSVCEGGELDVRGTYCLLVVATLLDLLTPELLRNVDEFLAACQTYEGGFACSAYSFDEGRSAMAEAHGGYTSCAVLSHFMLKSVVAGGPLASLGDRFPAPIDVKGAIRWGAMMQGEASEAGGFRGRSNKLVDGCYSWWVGGTLPVLEELSREVPRPADGDDEWVDVPSPSLFNRVALQEYVLLAAQRTGVVEDGEERNGGGLRDKPGKSPDLYHTCNNLAGLSIAQHHMKHNLPGILGKFDTTKGLPAVKPTTAAGGWRSEDERQQARRSAWASLLAWEEEDESEIVLGGDASRVNPTVPVVNIIGDRLRPFVNYFYSQ